MAQTILTFIAKVNKDRVSELDKLLESIAKPDVERNTVIPFPALKQLHFASLVLNDAPDYGAYLIFENNFDGPLDSYLEELYAQAAAGLHQIYSHCNDYSVASAKEKAALLSYLRAHVVRPNAYHIGNVGRSVVRTHQEAQLRDSIEDFRRSREAGADRIAGFRPPESASLRFRPTATELGRRCRAAPDGVGTFPAAAQDRDRGGNRTVVVLVADPARYRLGNHVALDRNS